MPLHRNILAATVLLNVGYAQQVPVYDELSVNPTYKMSPSENGQIISPGENFLTSFENHSLLPVRIESYIEGPLDPLRKGKGYPKYIQHDLFLKENSPPPHGFRTYLVLSESTCYGRWDTSKQTQEGIYQIQVFVYNQDQKKVLAIVNRSLLVTSKLTLHIKQYQYQVTVSLQNRTRHTVKLENLTIERGSWYIDSLNTLPRFLPPGQSARFTWDIRDYSAAPYRFFAEVGAGLRIKGKLVERFEIRK